MHNGTFSCRGCSSPQGRGILSLGDMPLANALLTAEDLDRSAEEKRYPLDLFFCEACCLVQIGEAVPPEELFTDYAYFSSQSSTMVTHAERLVEQLVHERQLGSGNLALEVASNDGYLLQHYVRRGVPVLGIDPAANVVALAEEKGVQTICDFFGDRVSKELVETGRKADVLHANNVLAHVPNLDEVVRSIARVLSTSSVAIIETPYVVEMIEKLEFDTIYHEHVFYYSLSAFARILRRNGLEAVDVERIPMHGGSLRVFAQRIATGGVHERVRGLLEEEERLGVCRFDYYADFARRVTDVQVDIRQTVEGLRAQGKRVAAYGAAAKGSILLNSIGLGRESIDFVVDSTPYKQGRYMPGVHIPIVPPEHLVQEMPDFTLILAWNFAGEIVAKEEDYRRRGGRFIVPIPNLTVLSGDPSLA